MKKARALILFATLVLLLMIFLSLGASVENVKAQTANVQLRTVKDGQAVQTTEKVHTSAYSVKLVIPSNSSFGSAAMALYPYNKTLNSIASFSVYASFTTAVPRFLIFLDTNGDGIADTFLLSDYQYVSDGSWKITTGGERWGWTESNSQLSSYGKTWDWLDGWKTQYGNGNVLYLGICLEYWAVNGSSQPLYADELIVNAATPAPQPTTSPGPTTPAPTQESALAPTPTSQPTPIPTNPTLPTPSLNLTCSSSATETTFKANIEGTLTNNNVGLSDSPVLLSYSLDGGKSWFELTYIKTQEDGSFSAQWLPQATGDFFIKATYPGNNQYSQATCIVDLAVTSSDDAKTFFSITSNSTLSELAFNSTSRELSFTVSGVNGTEGYVDANIPKSLINDVSDLKVNLDGQEISYTATGQNDYWLLHFTYHHSTHEVTITLGSLATQQNENAFENWILYIATIAIAVIVVTSIVLVLKRKKNYEKDSQASFVS